MPFVFRLLRTWLFPGAFRSGYDGSVVCHWWQDPLAHPVLEDMTPTELGDLYIDPAMIDAGPESATGHSLPTTEEKEPLHLGQPVPEPSCPA